MHPLERCRDTLLQEIPGDQSIDGDHYQRDYQSEDVEVDENANQSKQLEQNSDHSKNDGDEACQILELP